MEMRSHRQKRAQDHTRRILTVVCYRKRAVVVWQTHKEAVSAPHQAHQARQVQQMPMGKLQHSQAAIVTRNRITFLVVFLIILVLVPNLDLDMEAQKQEPIQDLVERTQCWWIFYEQFGNTIFWLRSRFAHNSQTDAVHELLVCRTVSTKKIKRDVELSTTELSH